MAEFLPQRGKEGRSRALLLYDSNAPYVIRADGTGKKRLRVGFHFCVRPDGKSACWMNIDFGQSFDEFDEEAGEACTIEICDLAKGKVKTLLAGSGIADLAWAPKGDSLWFSSGPDGRQKISRINVRTNKVQTFGFGVTPVPCPDNIHLAYFGKHPSGVFILNTKTGEATKIARDMPECWSLDGEYLAFVKVVEPAWHVFVWDRKTGKITQVSQKCASAYWPSWTPDGAVVFQGSDKKLAGGRTYIARASVDGKKLTKLTGGPHDERPRVHPTLGLIAFHKRDTKVKSKCQLCVMDGDGQNLEEIEAGSEAQWLS
jgi:Tol biopolymer transport system component